MSTPSPAAVSAVEPLPDPVVARPRLGPIRAVTYSVPDLAVVEDAYGRWLRYRPCRRGVVDPALAAFWEAPAAAGRRYLVLAPEAGTPTWLRFVEDPAAAGWRALVSHGWNVAEFVVADVERLAESFAGSPFRIVGAPTPLQRFPMIRAMQVIGPFGECLYFTEVGPGSGLDLARAECFVGRVFIVVAGGPDLEALFATYAAFDNAVDPPVATRVRVLSAANGLPPESEHRHGLVKLPGGTLVELDQYPAVTTPRSAAVGDLPPGLVSVSFAAARAPAGHAWTRLADPALPAPGARWVRLRGATGEAIELLEDADG